MGKYTGRYLIIFSTALSGLALVNYISAPESDSAFQMSTFGWILGAFLFCVGVALDAIHNPPGGDS